MSINNLLEQLGILTILLTVIATILGIIEKYLKFRQNDKDFQKHITKPFVRFLSFILSLAIPNGILISYYFYLAGLYPHRLSEDLFFISLVAQLIIGVSLYAFAWGKWVYPKLQDISQPSKKE